MINLEKLEPIIKDFSSGIKTEEMAEKYGFTYQSMRNFCHGLRIVEIITDEQASERRKILKKMEYEKRNYERNKKIRRMYEEEGKSITNIAEEVCMTNGGVQSVIKSKGYAKKTLPYPQNLVQAIFADDEISDFEEKWKVLVPIIADLPKREQFVISEKYKNGKTYEEIGEILGVTRQRAESIRAHAFGKIRSKCYKEVI